MIHFQLFILTLREGMNMFTSPNPWHGHWNPRDATIQGTSSKGLGSQSNDLVNMEYSDFVLEWFS